MSNFKFIYPPRATMAAIPHTGWDLLKSHGWQAQLKFNDSHVLLDYDGKRFVKAWNRHGQELVHDWSVLWSSLTEIGERFNSSGRLLLDGGLMHSRHAALKDHLVIWDVLVMDGKQLLGYRYDHRELLLHGLLGVNNSDEFRFNGEVLGWSAVDRVIVPDSFLPEDWERAWGVVERVNVGYEQPLLEGLMLKKVDARLEGGDKMNNNTSWLCRSRVTTKRHQF